MRTLKRTLIGLSALAALTLAGCEREPEAADADDVKRQARELAETLKSYSADQKEEALKEAGKALNDLNEGVEQLRERVSERWSEMDEATRRNARRELAQLEGEQAELIDRLEALRNASGDAWARVAQGFAAAYEELRDAWQETEADLPQ
jgi:peptidoglycan hydrolase CwlO-like protein